MRHFSYACKALVLILTGHIAGCGGSSNYIFNGDSSYYDSDTPKIEKQKVGRPYQIGGRWYTPAINPNYDEVGIASWYGPGFDGRPTANGETFDEDTISAAHTTLPLPSYVEVTNLDNGKQLYVRVNDRGPFADDRIIDLSKRAAELLGSKSTGLARVRVTVAPPPRNVTLISPDGQRFAGKPYKASGQGIQLANNTPNNNTGNPVNKLQPIMGNLPLYTGTTQQANITSQPFPDANPSMMHNSSGNYAVNIGVFSDKTNVESLKQNLTALGNVQITPHYKNGQTLNKVSLTGYQSQEEALNIVNNLTQMGIYDAKIISQ